MPSYNYDRSFNAPVGFFIDFASFLTDLARTPDMRAEILIAADEDFRLEPGQSNARRLTDDMLRGQAKNGGFFGSEVHAFAPGIGQGGKSVDKSYMIRLDIAAFTVDVIGISTPLNARSEDGWRPYYGSRKPSWDPGHGLPTPMWRGKRGFLTVFTEDPWLRMRVNPNPTPWGKTQDLDIRTWVAIGDFCSYVLGTNVELDSMANLVTYLNRLDGKLEFTNGAWFGTSWYDHVGNLNRDKKKQAAFRSADSKYYFFDEDPKEMW